MLKNKTYNILWTFCLILTICFIINRPSLAAEPPHDFSMSVSYGYDNYQKNDRDMPVWVRFTNRGAAFAGELKLSINDGTFAGLTFSQHISVLSDSEEEFVFYIPCLEAYTDITLTLTDEESKEVTELTEKTLNKITDDIYLGILSENYKETAELTDELVFSSPVDASYVPVRSVNLSGHKLPESEEGYDGLDIILVNRFDASYMTETQAKALKNWIKNGGILLTGTAADMSVFFEKLELSPQKADSTQTIYTDFGADYQTYIHLEAPIEWTKLKPNPTEQDIEDARYYYYTAPNISSDILSNVKAISIDVDNLYASPDNPFINKEFYQKLDLENGRIIVSKFDFTSEAFTNFGACNYVFQQMLAENINHANWAHFSNYSDNFRNVWSSQSLLLNTLYKKVPNYGKYMLILFVYILIIGPVLYIILKKIDRRYLLWITVPLTTIIFTGIIFAVGKDTRHTSPFINYASFIDGDSDEISEDTLYSVTMPDKENYSQHIIDDYTVRPVNNNYSDTYSVWNRAFGRYFNNVNSNNGLSYISDPEGGTNIAVDNDVLFSTRFFNLHKPDMDFSGIEENIAYKDGYYTGTINNTTDYNLHNACLIISGQIYSLGNINAHTQISFHLRVKDVADLEKIEQDIMKALNISKEHKNTGEALVKTNMFFQFISNTYANGYQSNGYPYLIGYMPDYRPNAFDNTDIPVTGMTLFHKKMSIHYQDGSAMYIPDISQLMSVQAGEVYGLSREIYSQEVIAGIDFDNRFVPEKLQLISGNENILIYAYNYTNKVYDPLFLESTVCKTNGRDYFDENKILQLKFVQKVPYTNEPYKLPVISAAGKVN